MHVIAVTEQTKYRLNCCYGADQIPS